MSSQGLVLLVDDERPLLEAETRHLQRAGFEVEPCTSASEALARLDERPFDTIVTDIMMPGMDGVEFLKSVRERSREVPVILVTGSPTVESAARAIQYGALKYLLKPVGTEDLVRTISRAVQLHRLDKLKRQALAELGTLTGESGDRAALEASFEHALASLWIAYQPIIDARERSIFGYEALLRSNESSLPHPGAVLDAAERLGRLQDLGRAIRERAISVLAGSAGNWRLFLNLHPQDLLDDALFELVEFQSDLAAKLVFEITERASLDHIDDAKKRIAALREAGAHVAVDDLGAGYAGLSSFVLLEPDIVKLDMSLVRDVDKSATKLKLIRSLTDVCREMKLAVVAEGIETAEERDVVISAGCDLLQGYRFGKPSRELATPRW